MMSTGLDGVVAATTRLSHVDGERGELVIAGFNVEELAEHATFEETTWLLWHGDLPSAQQLSEFRERLGANAALSPSIVDVLRTCAHRRLDVMDALGAALLTLKLEGDDGPGIVGRVPTIVATYWRLLCRHEPLAPRPDLGYAGSFLFMLHGCEPYPDEVSGLETYLNTVVDHGLNASTFTARVITSTGSDLKSAVVGAIGALKGPLHGGAPGPALDMVLEIGEASRAEAFLRTKLESGEKLMGFGHRVYKVRDPRADVLAKAAERLFMRVGDMSLYTLARSVEADALRLLETYKPGRRLQTNVEFYTALLLHGLGLHAALFTPVFVMSRVSGWIAHAIEQRQANRLIRPQSEYVGPRGMTWVPLAERNGSHSG
ncbi:MAG TPA: citrate synthase [Vicinamibacterales bacterium]|nr:citrate synthase [Vicinamibacterales bacterium]